MSGWFHCFKGWHQWAELSLNARAWLTRRILDQVLHSASHLFPKQDLAPEHYLSSLPELVAPRSLGILSGVGDRAQEIGGSCSPALGVVASRSTPGDRLKPSQPLCGAHRLQVRPDDEKHWDHVVTEVREQLINGLVRLDLKDFAEC